MMSTSVRLVFAPKMNPRDYNWRWPSLRTIELLQSECVINYPLQTIREISLNGGSGLCFYVSLPYNGRDCSALGTDLM